MVHKTICFTLFLAAFGCMLNTACSKEDNNSANEIIEQENSFVHKKISQFDFLNILSKDTSEESNEIKKVFTKVNKSKKSFSLIEENDTEAIDYFYDPLHKE